MTLASGFYDYIDPSIKYNLSSDFYVDKQSDSVYILQKQNVPKNTIIDFNKIPFNNGKIYILNDPSYYGNKAERINIKGKIYCVSSSIPFRKGTYCGQQYHLASKIAYINQHLRKGERPYCPGVRFTHEGNAIVYNGYTRPLAALDLWTIEKGYLETCCRQRIGSIRTTAYKQIYELVKFCGGGDKGYLYAGTILASGLFIALCTTHIAIKALVKSA